MRIKSVFLYVLLAVMTTAANSQTAGSRRGTAATAPAAIEGVWRAEIDGLPAITLIVTNESGTLTGAIQFYFHHRDAVGQLWVSTPGLPEPLFNLKFDGTTLTFQVSHRRAHPPRTLADAPVSCRLTLTGPNKGELVNESESSPAIEVVRSEY